MTEAQARAAIVAEALSWEGTPYESNQRVKGVAVDCAQLPAAVFHACGFIPDLSPKYSGQWMLHRDEELYLDEVRRWAREIPLKSVKGGDLIVWKYGRTYSHSAIVIDLPIVIHAVKVGGAVIRADIERDEQLARLPKRYFSVFGHKAS